MDLEELWHTVVSVQTQAENWDRRTDTKSKTSTTSVGKSSAPSIPSVYGGNSSAPIHQKPFAVASCISWIASMAGLHKSSKVVLSPSPLSSAGPGKPNG